MALDTSTVEQWIGRTAIDRDGSKVGKIEQIYVDDETGQPEWMTVKTGLFGGSASFVPLSGSRTQGEDVVVAYAKDQVKDAPRVEQDSDGHLRPEEEDELYRYYGVAQAGYPESGDSGRRGERAQGHDTSGPTTDDAMTRSEEELRVRTTRQEAGRVRLRKYVVSERVQTTVPVSHEEVRIEREPITDANRAQALSGPDLSEEEHEVVLHAEQPVVEKTVVPKERVRLETDTVTDRAEISEGVRKERIETEGDVDAGRRPS